MTHAVESESGQDDTGSTGGETKPAAESLNSTPAKWARTLLEYLRSRSTLFVQRGILLEALGNDGLQEALRRGWLVPDHVTGELQLTSSLAKIRELEEAAWPDTAAGDNAKKQAEEEPVAVGDEVVVAEQGKTLTGVVKEVRPDGRVVVSFNGAAKRDYAPTEVRKTKTANAATPAYQPYRP